MLKQRNECEMTKSPRFTTVNPTPFIVGRNSETFKRNNEFALLKFDYHRCEWRKIHSIDGWREGHAMVQVDHFLYILGGKDANGLILNKVKAQFYLLFI